MAYVAPIKIKPSQVPVRLKGSFKGRRFSVVLTESVHIPMDAGLWSGGSRDVYRLGQGSAKLPSWQGSGPFGDSGRTNTRVELNPGDVVVRESCFQGKDSMCFYTHPSNASMVGL